MHKTIRPGSYAILNYKKYILLVKKSRGPFLGMLDLPGWKIEHGENPVNTVTREISEELGIQNITSPRLQGVYSFVSQHTWKNEEYHEHMLGVVYECEALDFPDMTVVTTNLPEENDSSDYVLTTREDALMNNLTPICRQALEIGSKKNKKIQPFL